MRTSILLGFIVLGTYINPTFKFSDGLDKLIANFLLIFLIMDAVDLFKRK